MRGLKYHPKRASLDPMTASQQVRVSSGYTAIHSFIITNACRFEATGGVIGPQYASSKSALHGLMHWVASRYAKDGVVRSTHPPSISYLRLLTVLYYMMQTCNAVAPALIIGVLSRESANPLRLLTYILHLGTEMMANPPDEHRVRSSPCFCLPS